MKKLLLVIMIFGLTGSIVLAQNTQTVVAQPGQTVVVQPGQTVVVAQPGQSVQVVQKAPKPASAGPSVRLHGYATYALNDNHVGSDYSATSYFDGSVKGGFQYGGGIEVMPYPAAGIEFTYLRLDSKASNALLGS